MEAVLGPPAHPLSPKGTRFHTDCYCQSCLFLSTMAILDINGLSKANINNKNSYMLYTRDIQYTNTVPLKKKVVQYL